MNIDHLTVRQRIHILKWVFLVAEVLLVLVAEIWIVLVGIAGQVGSPSVVVYIVVMTAVAIGTARLMVSLANREIDRYEREQNESGRGETR